MKIKITPFGEVDRERLEEAKKYKLVEMTAGFWRLTKKCKQHYDLFSYIEYLRGNIERDRVQRVSNKQEGKQEVEYVKVTKQTHINQLLAL